MGQRSGLTSNSRYHSLYVCEEKKSFFMPNINMNKIHNTIIAAAGTLFSLYAMPAFADNNTDNTNEESTEISVHVAEELDKMPGIKLSPETFKNYVTNGQPRTDASKIFLLYNVGQKKFLSLGGYWGTHATLKDVAHLFWLQRRNDTTEKHTCYLRYPLTENTTTGGTTTDNYLSNILNLNSLQVGSAEGDGRSNATYNYVRLVSTDGTSENLFDEGYAPKGNKFTEQVTNFDQNTQSIEAEIDLSTCKKGVAENILSVGNKIAAWGAEDATYNLHIYYRISDNELEIDYVSKKINNGTKIKIKSIDPATPLTLKLSKNGLYVNGNLVSELAVAHIPVIKYDEKLAGDIVRFAKNTDGSLKIDANGYYVIDQENGSGIMGDYDDYLYAYESKSENKQTYFISSAFQKSGAAEKEGNYLARTAYDSGAAQYGSVGLYADRSVLNKYLQEGQWSIDPVDGQEGVYTFSITFTKGHEYYVQELDTLEGKGFKDVKKTAETDTQMFMQATSEYVKSSNLKDNNGNYYNDPTGENIKTLTGVELLTTTPAELGSNAANAYWKIISMADYYKLLDTESSQMKGEVDLTFMLADPNFERESARLAQWTNDGLEDTETLKIGLDTYYKTNPKDEKYTNTYNGNSTAFNNMLSNHGRALGAMIYNGGRGRLYQDAKVYRKGWYTIQCGGMTNANGKLFVQRVDNNQVSEPVMKTLTTLTDDDIAKFKKPSAHQLGWPYTDDMPMYNAVLEINDLNLNDGKYVEKYKNSVKIFIREASDDKPVTLRFGVEVAEEASLVPMLEDETGDDTTNKTVSTKDEMTIFDDFHLLFNGVDEQPDLVLSENWTDLNYIENAKYTYDLQPLHLERTFSKGDSGNNWNTIILPVALTETQVKEAFGENTKLAKLYALTDKNILFTYEEPNANGVLLRAYTPYIIKPDKEKGSSTKHNVDITLNDGSTVRKEVGENHFDFGAVTLSGKKQKNETTDEYYYPISSDYPNYVASYATSNDTETLGTMTIYGTLCRTYTTTDGVNSIINNRPTLKGGNCFIMKNNVMYQVPDMPNGYGLRGLRCWFEYTDPTTGQSVDLSQLKLNINGIEDDATSISDITANDGIQTIARFADGIYSASGERIAGVNNLSALPKGIYIVNGKKFIK